MNLEPITISLPSLIHRIGGDNTKIARAFAEQCNCRMQRVRRSRHWQVTGEFDDLKQLFAMLKLESYDDFRFVYTKMEAHIHQIELTHEPLNVKLRRLIENNPAITLAELMSMTHCSLIEARIARDEAEF
ncbi:ribosome recycling factor [Vibrio sinensis]|uniref:Ribosome recycling factor n=1 Tax=Vibrio sinensis TaxID=2302434 RepID=A0A3A6R1Q8_9VIBR|nr:ribosome recycling factor family protein [Vibrio sinensis]RJX75244.1 ribosome recycling factor [Vibrio sinensis]